MSQEPNLSLPQADENVALELRKHQRNTACYAHLIAVALGWPDDDREILRIGGENHDIGKLYIPNEILQNPGHLSYEDFERVKEHAGFGATSVILSKRAPEHLLERIRKIVWEHHEHWDGTGYPRKLKGEEIDILSRAISIADCSDVMLRGRPYSPPKSPVEVAREIIRCAGTQFDPKLARIFAGILLVFPDLNRSGVVAELCKSDIVGRLNAAIKPLELI